jgi:uncharacterized protein (DUF2344 family)
MKRRREAERLRLSLSDKQRRANLAKDIQYGEGVNPLARANSAGAMTVGSVSDITW